MQVHDVVVEDRTGLRGRVDPDVAHRAGAVQPVVHADVVRHQATGRAAFEVDAGGRVAVHAVADDPLAGGLVVVDPVVPVAVADVVGHQVAVGAGVKLDPGVLVVVGHVVADRVAAAAQVDAGRGPGVLAGVEVRGVADHQVAGRALGEVDTRVGVAVGGVGADRRVGGTDQLEALGEPVRVRLPRAGDPKAGQRDVAAAGDVDAVGERTADGQPGHREVAAVGQVDAVGQGAGTGDGRRGAGQRGHRDRGGRGTRRHAHLLGVRAVADVQGLAGQQPGGALPDGAVRRGHVTRAGVRAPRVGPVGVERGHRRGGWRRTDGVLVDDAARRAGDVVAAGRVVTDLLNAHAGGVHVDPGVGQVEGPERGVRVGASPRDLLRGRGTHGDVGDPVDRLEPLVVVRVAVDVEHVLAVRGAQRVEDAGQRRVARVEPGGVRRPVPEGDDVVDARVVLRGGHQVVGV